jgi:hypothetical protein
MTIDLRDYQLLPIFVVSLVVILAASEIGRRLGVHAGGRGGENVSNWKARSSGCWR